MIITYEGGPLDGEAGEAPNQPLENLGNVYRYGPIAWTRKTKDGEAVTEAATPQSSPPNDWVSYRAAVYVRYGRTFRYLRDEEIDRCITVEKNGRRCFAISIVGSAHCDKHADRKRCAALLPSGRCKVKVEPGSNYCRTHGKVNGRDI